MGIFPFESVWWPVFQLPQKSVFRSGVSGSSSTALLPHLSLCVTFPKEDLCRSCANLLGAVIHQGGTWVIHLYTWQLPSTHSRCCPEELRSDRNSSSEREPQHPMTSMCGLGEEIPKRGEKQVGEEEVQKADPWMQDLHSERSGVCLGMRNRRK